MSQPSDAKNVDYSARGTKRFDVWGASTDPFNHTELARNWDTLDGLIGRPSDGQQWPPSFGVGGGIWREIQDLSDALDSRDVPIGTITQWFRPSSAVPLSYIQNKGWLVCDGSKVLAANHDFPSFTGDFWLPDLRNRFIVGADLARTAGTAGTTTQAPGELVTTAGGNSGEAGAHSKDHKHTVSAHTHTVGNHSHSVAQHTHQVQDHRHDIGGNTGGPVQGSETVKDGGGTTHQVSFYQHSHSLPGKTGSVSGGGLPLAKLDGPTTTGAAGATTSSSSGGGDTSTTSIDVRPLHVGLLVIMKVRNP